ncbi:1-acyl-sn-glycerol-3-phosphate acyltransferase [Cellulomonas sp.]|uniref:1-acyl-sn-glycerol-3-phosphate acyltransferase n=1 Tax=Cellulomonas sp. TaxID=40001 RepID=UPI001B0A5B89|nr:1-acyl-sn-glycerol-3-phosphate acyltransferase [Cellulomonas sp.]MBO9554527.1 1-acyl-sn-glycerol-3-phosphate acyltransferase [Cellulomonas sp.]
MSWRLPPRWVRRVVLAPAVVLAAVLLVPTSLLLVVFLLGALTWLVPGKLRIPRIAWMASFYVLWDAAVILAAFGLWIGSGFGVYVHRPAFTRAHYRLADRMLVVLFWQVRWTLRLDIEVVDADLGVVLTGTPVVVASRHAGPGDSFILVHALLSWFDRAPRIVLKDTLQWDPAIDILLNRLPAQFVTPRGSRRAGAAGGSDAVGELARDLGPRDALLIFPEGGNVTPRRRLARIDALRKAGRFRLAADAEQMRNVMAPHSGGILSALDEAPQAGVVFVAHTGLDKLVTVADIWRELPMDKRIVMKGWSVPPDEVPREPAAQEEWLFASWLRIDEWISANEVPTATGHHVPPVGPDAPAAHLAPAPDAPADAPQS